MRAVIFLESVVTILCAEDGNSDRLTPIARCVLNFWALLNFYARSIFIKCMAIWHKLQFSRRIYGYFLENISILVSSFISVFVICYWRLGLQCIFGTRFYVGLPGRYIAYFAQCFLFPRYFYCHAFRMIILFRRPIQLPLFYSSILTHVYFLCRFR